MSRLEKFIKEYYDHSFEDWGGTTSEDYKTFERKYKMILKEIGNEIGLELYSFNKNHYEFSAVMKKINEEKYYYISISDVRYWKNEWFNNILYRTMSHAKDWSGGSNNYSDLLELKYKLKSLMERGY